MNIKVIARTKRCKSPTVIRYHKTEEKLKKANCYQMREWKSIYGSKKYQVANPYNWNMDYRKERDYRKNEGHHLHPIRIIAKRRPQIALYLSMAKIGFVGFGGGSALIPVIEREVVEEKELIHARDYNQVVVEACVTPGALPVEMAAGLGKRAGGVKSMLMSSWLIALPGVFLTVLILSILSSVSTAVLDQIRCLSIGIGAFISCLLIAYAVNTMQAIKKEGNQRLWRSQVIMVGVFLLSFGENFYSMLGVEMVPLFGLSTVQVLLLTFFGILYTECRFTKKNVPIITVISILYIFSNGQAQIIDSFWIRIVLHIVMAGLSVYGLAHSVRRDSKRKGGIKRKTLRPLARELIGWVVFLSVLSIPAFIVTFEAIPYILRGFASSFISFGGGDAYLSVADGMFLRSGFVANSDFYGNLVPIANVLPGSILCKMLAGIGYYFGYSIEGSIVSGYLVALAGFACSVAASGSVFCVFAYLFETFEDVTIFRQISRWIRPIIAGLLLNVMFSMVTQNVSSGSDLGIPSVVTLLITLLILGIDFFLLFARKTVNWKLIVFSTLSSFLVCNLAILLLS